MDRSRLLFALTILLGVASTVLPSNPDSEIVQDGSELSRGTKHMSAEFRSFNDQRKDSGPPLPGVRVMRPYLMGSRIVWREVGVSRPFSRESAIRRPGLPAPGNDKSSIGSGKSVETSKPGLELEEDSAGRIPEVSKPDEPTGLASPDSEGDENLETSEGKGTKGASGEDDENIPTAAQNHFKPPPFKPPTPIPGEKVSPTHQTPQPVPIAPPQNVPGNPESTHNKRVSPDSNLFAGIVNNFAFKLMESLNPESNFVISPLSIFVALAMCYLGSGGNTKAQLEQVLGMNEKAVHDEHLHQGMKDLISVIVPQSSEFQLLVANGMFLGKHFVPEAPFMKEIQQYYAAEIKNLDFLDGQASLKAINEWVANNTVGMIPKMLSNSPPPSTRLILLNAIYFKGAWKMPFPKDRTFNGRFHSWGGKEKKVPTMMLRNEEFPFHRSDELKHSFIKLPYEGDQVSMVIALPYSTSDKPMPTMTDQQLCHVLDAMRNTELGLVAIPKFRLEYSKSLRRPLAGIGITDLFGNSADLSRLRRSKDLQVSGILHRAVVEVNEEGTAAAAATEVRIVPMSYRMRPEFVASHPFAFYIVHEPSGLVLFHGKVFDFVGDDGDEPVAAAAPGGGRNEEMNVRPRPVAKGRGRDRPRVRLHGAVNYESAE